MDDDTPKAITNLKAAGADMWNEFKDPIKSILREIIDQKYGKTAPAATPAADAAPVPAATDWDWHKTNGNI